MTATAAAARAMRWEEDEDLPLLLATTWRLLLDDLAARLPPTQRSRRLLRQFEKFGPGCSRRSSRRSSATRCR